MLILGFQNEKIYMYCDLLEEKKPNFLFDAGHQQTAFILENKPSIPFLNITLSTKCTEFVQNNFGDLTEQTL